MDKTIIYYTDNSLDKDFMHIIQKHLLGVARDIPIISVSQKPIDFGTNICVGDIGHSHTSLFKQILIGTEAAKTDIVFLVEHDCMYTPEHFDFVPKFKDTFYYNVNCWFVQWNKNRELDGQYTYRKHRYSLSQCVGYRESMMRVIKEKLNLLAQEYEIKRGVAGACEPGVCINSEAFIKTSVEIKDLDETGSKWKAEEFKTRLPNLDIRHGENFSGQRRGRRRTSKYWIPYWGNFKKVMATPPDRWQPDLRKDIK